MPSFDLGSAVHVVLVRGGAGVPARPPARPPVMPTSLAYTPEAAPVQHAVCACRFEAHDPCLRPSPCASQMLDCRIHRRQVDSGLPPEQQDEQPPMQDSLARFHLVGSLASWVRAWVQVHVGLLNVKRQACRTAWCASTW